MYSRSFKHHLDTLFVILSVIVGINSHNISSDISRTPINQLRHQYHSSFIDFILDPRLPEILKSLNIIDKNLAIEQTEFKLVDAQFRRPSTICAFLSNTLSVYQIKLCQRHQGVLETILPQIIRLTEIECKRITRNLKWNCSAFRILFDRSNHLAHTREGALVRSILNASMMYLVAKVCSESSHRSCGCLSGQQQLTSESSELLPTTQRKIVLGHDQLPVGSNHENQTNRPIRSLQELSSSDLNRLDSGSPLHLSVAVRQGCVTNTAFAEAFTKVFIDFDETKALNRASKILNENSYGMLSDPSNVKRLLDSDYKDLAYIKWTKSAINLHNNHIGRKVVREATQKRCRCHGLSGSCQVQTCWIQLLDISVITSRLRSIYLIKAAKTETRNSGSLEKPDLYLTEINEEGDQTRPLKLVPNLNEDKYFGIKRVGPEQLLYLYDSPEYCEPQPKLGHLGTKGRLCMPSNNVTMKTIEEVSVTESIIDGQKKLSDLAGEEDDLGLCERLCCNRGYHSELVFDVVPCNCRFRFCCRLDCENCLRQTAHYHCS